MSQLNADREIHPSAPRLHALDGLRVLFMVVVFLSHCTYLGESSDAAVRSLFHDVFHYGVLGVGFFFLLSGFVTCFQSGERFDSLSVSEYGVFIRKKLRRIFPAYLICLVVVFVMKWISEGTPYLQKNGLLFLIDLTMLQTLVPSAAVFHSVNASLWFLSCLFIIELVAPLLLMVNRFFRASLKRTSLAIIIVLALYVLIVQLTLQASDAENGSEIQSLIYYSPVFRVFYYAMGILCANLLSLLSPAPAADSRKLSPGYSLGEVLSLGSVIILYLFRNRLLHSRIISHTYMLPLLAVLVTVFAFQRGFLSRFLSARPFRWLSSFSLEFYLVHFIIIVAFIRNLEQFSRDIPHAAAATVLVLVVSVLAAKVFNLVLKTVMKGGSSSK